MKRFIGNILVLCILFFMTNNAYAVSILIGDVDGFGFTDTSTLQSAQGTAADTNGNGIIEEGEFLPDLDGEGHTWVNGHDEFDNRSAAEASSSVGAQWTDISLEDRYNGFPDSPADDAFFSFTFAAPTVGDSDYGATHYINLLFGDYDVRPMRIDVDGTTVGLTRQNNNVADGLVQLAYAEVSWANMLDGVVNIDIIAPNEPYIALDYAFLDTDHQAPTADPVPEPATMILLGSGLVGLAGIARKKKK